MAVLAGGAGALVDDGLLLGADQGPVGAVDLDVEAAGVAQVLTGCVATPEWGFCRSTVYTNSLTAHA